MERAGRGLADVVASVAPDGPIADRLRQGQQRRRRVRRGAAPARGRARGARPGGRARERAERRRARQRRARRRRRALRGGAPGRLRGRGRRAARHGLLGHAARRRWPTPSRRSTTPALPIVAADVPSGVDAASGVVEGAAIRARATATFAAAKPGLWINPGKAHAGTVRVIDIGIPRGRAGRRARRRPHRRRRSCSRCCPRAAPGGPSSRAATCSSRAARAGSPARRRWPPRPRSARAPATSPPASPPPRSRSSPSGCSRR